jgi:hypothetical protein
MGTCIAGSKEQFVDVALAIADMHDALRLCEKYSGLLHVLQPAIALFLPDWYTRWTDRPLESVRPMELIPGPELDCASPRGSPCWGTAILEYISTPRIV